MATTVTHRDCSREGCSRHAEYRAAGLCRKHYGEERKPAWSRAARERMTPEEKAARVEATRAWRARVRLTDEYRAATGARAKAWREENREAHAAASVRDRLRRKVGRDACAVEYAEMLLHDPCAYCGGPAGTVDHIEPLVAGGSNSWDNLTAACRSCNSRKRSAPLLLSMLGDR